MCKHMVPDSWACDAVGMQLQNSGMEKPRYGGMNQHALTQTPLTHTPSSPSCLRAPASPLSACLTSFQVSCRMLANRQSTSSTWSSAAHHAVIGPHSFTSLHNGAPHAQTYTCISVHLQGSFPGLAPTRSKFEYLRTCMWLASIESTSAVSRGGGGVRGPRGGLEGAVVITSTCKSYLAASAQAEVWFMR